jgi:Zn-dependent M16 (insulinase) family peptidase
MTDSNHILHGFELIKEETIAEINSVAMLYRHIKTGAELLSLVNDDDNKAFAITFATPPDDSTGLPHILEHSVLCGSRKYPTKEPFVDLLKGSLATFINAMTFSDKTMYPVASQNLKDFYNLVDVYLDAVFFPRITPEVLMQEGWHFEIESPDQPLEYSGVVFNEMKGAYSSADDALDNAIHSALFPDTIYGLDSGGDPAAIPDLTFEAFKKYHETYYHPSNARIFFSGDDDPIERLRLLDEYLSQFDAIDVKVDIPLQPKFDAPCYSEHYYASGDSDDAKSYITVSWLLPETGDEELTLSLDILNHILLGTQASPLKKALLESGLGEETAGGGFEDSMRQMSFTTGMRGVEAENVRQVEDLILKTLQGLVDNGIDLGQIEASLNTAEFQLREFNTGGFPRGLVNCLRAFSTWLYGGDPVAPLAFEAPLQSIKQKIASGERYFESLIDDLLLKNTHRSTVALFPDPDLEQKRDDAERARLDAIKASMTPEQIEEAIANTFKLREIQNTPDTPEALATLPKLEISDIDPKVRAIPLDHINIGGVPTLYHDLPTNSIAYLDIGFNLKTLPADYLPYLSIFNRALLQMGTTKEDYVSLIQRIGRRTGGLRISTMIEEKRHSNDLVGYLFFKGKSTIPQLVDLLDIVQDVIQHVNFDDEARFMQLVLSEKSYLESSLIPSGHRVVVERLSSQFSEAGLLREHNGGIGYLMFLRDLISKVEDNWKGVRDTLNQMRERLFNRAHMLLNITTDSADWRESVQVALADFVDSVPFKETQPETWYIKPKKANEALTLPAQVNYVGKGANLYQLGYQYHGSSQVAISYLNLSYLWNQVRVQGGAYGAGLSFNLHTGMASYYSYRDPNVAETLKVYDEAGEYLRNVDISPDELTKILIGTVGDVDRFMMPDAKGFTSMVRYLINYTDEERQKVRDEMLSTTIEHIRQFADALDLLAKQGHVVVLGSSQSIENATEQLPSDLDIIKVL